MIVFVITGIVLVVAAVVVAVVTALRSREARSDWLGELSDIRLSSLGDTEEVTGAIAAIPSDDDDDEADSLGVESAVVTDEADSPEHDEAGLPEDEVAPPENDDARDGGSVIHDLTNSSDRTVDDGTEQFAEYTIAQGGVLRISTGATATPRVMATHLGDVRQALAIDLMAGQAWIRTGDAAIERLTVRTPIGWVTVHDGMHMVIADAAGWSYVMCLDGSCTVQSGDDADDKMVLTPGDIGRGRSGAAFASTSVGVEALESEGVVRRHRRLDGKGGFARPEESSQGNVDRG